MYPEREKGIALVIVMGFILLVAIAAMSFILTSLSEIKMVRKQNDSTRAFYLAEAGVQLAVAALNNSEWDGWTEISEPYADVNENGQWDDDPYEEPYTDINGNGQWDEGLYTKTVLSSETGGLSTGDIHIYITNPTSITPQVDAIGYAPNSTASDKIERAVRAKLEKSASSSLAFDYCICTQLLMTLQDTATGVVGNVHSNGNIMNTGASVIGTATSHEGVISGQGYFDNGDDDVPNCQEQADEVIMPTLDMADYLAKAEQGNGDYAPIGGEWTVDDEFNADNPFTISDYSTNGIIYVSGNFKVEGGAVIKGPGIIVATGTIKIEGGDADDAPEVGGSGTGNGAVGLFSGSNHGIDHDDGPAVKVEVSSTCYTTIFAPNGGVKIEGPEETPVSVYGSIVAKSVLVETGSQLTWMDLSGDVSLPGSTEFSISSWCEQ